MKPGSWAGGHVRWCNPSGKTQYDGCEVEVRLLEQLYCSQQLSLRLSKAGHRLQLHSPTWPPQPHDGRARQLSFVLRLRCGTQLSFRKSVTPGEYPCRCDEKPFQMELSWPCGLHIQFVTHPNGGATYVKQSYLVHHEAVRSGITNEKKRCYQTDGNVLRFVQDGLVNIMCADSSFFMCEVEREAPRSRAVSETKTVRPKTQQRRSRAGSKVKEKASSKSIVSEKIEKVEQLPQSDTEVEGHISSYTVMRPNGRQWRKSEGVEKEMFPRCLLRTYTDWEIHETFYRRGDGTNVLLRADGSRIVAFPDGTRITTYVEEDQTEVFCEWTKEELATYSEWYSRRKDGRFATRRNTSRNVITLLDEGYIFVRLRYRMEHQNYATVVSNGEGQPLELLMPQGTRVLVFPDKTYRVDAAGKVSLLVQKNSAHFTHGDSCESELDFDGFNFTDDTKDWCRVLCHSKDSAGKWFDVTYSGETVCLTDKGMRTPKPHADFRCFVVNRDLSGEELVHEDVAAEWLRKAQRRSDEAVVKHRLEFATHLNYHLTMCPVDETESERWLMKLEDVDMSADARHDVNRIPSTYGSPPSWFHPFPKHMQEDIEDDRMEQSPDVLQVRLLTEVAPRGGEVVRAVAAALRRYREAAVAALEADVCEDEPTESRSEEDDLARQLRTSAANIPHRHKSKHVRPRWQDKTSPAALELYHIMLARKGRLSPEQMDDTRGWVDHAAKLAVAKSRLRRRLKKAEENRRALRHHTVPPYFSSRWGVAFSLTDDLTSRVVAETSRRSPSGASSDSDLTEFRAAAAVSCLRW